MTAEERADTNFDRMDAAAINHIANGHVNGAPTGKEHRENGTSEFQV